MPEFPSVVFLPTVITRFARTLVTTLKRRGWSDKEIESLDVQRVCGFMEANTDLKREAYKIKKTGAVDRGDGSKTTDVPAFCLYEQVIAAIRRARLQLNVVKTEPEQAFLST